MTETDLPTAPEPRSAAEAGESWPTEAHRRQLAESLERGWAAALGAYDAANARLMQRRHAREATAAAPPKDPDGGTSGPGSEAEAKADKAVLDEARLTAAAKAALAGVEAAWRALALVRPADAARGSEARQPDAGSVAESRRRLAAVPDGREPPAEDEPGRDGPGGQGTSGGGETAP